MSLLTESARKYMYETNHSHTNQSLHQSMNIYNRSAICNVVRKIECTRVCNTHMMQCGRPSATCVVCVTGGAQSGKRSLAEFIKSELRNKITRVGVEVKNCDITCVSTLTNKLYLEYCMACFVSVVIVCAKQCTHCDVTVKVADCLSAPALYKHLGIRMNVLSACGMNMSLAMSPVCDSLDTMHLNLLKRMYTKRCRASIHVVADDMDYLSQLTVLQNVQLTELFIKRMPHVRNHTRMTVSDM